MFCNRSFASGVAVALEVVVVVLVVAKARAGSGRGLATADGRVDEEEEDGMPRISASAVELDAAMRLAAMMRARCVRGLKAEVEPAVEYTVYAVHQSLVLGATRNVQFDVRSTNGNRFSHGGGPGGSVHR